MDFYGLILVAITEIVSMVYILKLRSEEYFILNNNIYRFIVFIFIRIPFWLWFLYFSIITDYGRFYVTKYFCVACPFLMVLLDVMWLNSNIEIIYKNAVEFYNGELSKISKKIKK